MSRGTGSLGTDSGASRGSMDASGGTSTGSGTSSGMSGSNSAFGSGSSLGASSSGASQQWRSASFDQRNNVLDSIESQIKVNNEAADRQFRSAGRLDGASKANADAMRKDLKAREKSLEQKLKAARKAKAENWEQARSDLISEYEAYSRSQMQAQGAAGSSDTLGTGTSGGASSGGSSTSGSTTGSNTTTTPGGL